MKKFGFAALAIIIGISAAHADGNAGNACVLVQSMQGVFKTLRTLAFVGAAFAIAGWAWGFISGGEAKMDDLKKKGIGLLVGFTLLFGIGVILSFLPGMAGCASVGW